MLSGMPPFLFVEMKIPLLEKLQKIAFLALNCSKIVENFFAPLNIALPQAT